MRRELAAFGRQAGTDERRFDLAVQMLQRRIACHAGPDRARPGAVAEVADAVEAEREGGRLHAGQRGIDIAERRFLHLADETERQVHRLRRQPARAGHAAAEQGETLADALGQLYGDEEAEHWAGSRRRRSDQRNSTNTPV